MIVTCLTEFTFMNLPLAHNSIKSSRRRIPMLSGVYTDSCSRWVNQVYTVYYALTGWGNDSRAASVVLLKLAAKAIG
jgi:hypothetical protein